MKQRSDGQATRRRLLHAAAHHVATHGPARLTIDSAAQAAGLSKGAVLYHFKTKDALVSALLESVLDGFDSATEAVMEGSELRHVSYAAAYAQVSFDPRSKSPESSAGLLAAVTKNIDLLAPAAKRHEVYQRRLEADGIPPAIATLVRLAADGLFFARAFRLAPPSDALTADVLKMLLSLVASSEPVGE